jgi:hypothetical protein
MPISKRSKLPELPPVPWILADVTRIVKLKNPWLPFSGLAVLVIPPAGVMTFVAGPVYVNTTSPLAIAEFRLTCTPLILRK